MVENLLLFWRFYPLIDDLAASKQVKFHGVRWHAAKTRTTD